MNSEAKLTGREAARKYAALSAARQPGSPVSAAACPGAHGAQRRLLHVFPSFDIGGAQVRFAAIVQGLGEGFSHTVVSLSDGYGAAALLPPEARVRLAAPFPKVKSLPAQIRSHRNHLSELRPDLLLTYNWGAMEVATANFGWLPHVHMEDGFGPEEAERQFPRRIWARRLALARSEVVVPSLTLQEIAVHTWRLNARKVHYIPNGIAPKSTFATKLEDLGLDLPPDLPKVVWAGALRPEKNLVRLLRAFAPIKDQASLLLIGEGPEREVILREAERLALGPRLRLLGRRADVRDLIMQCQILVLSSDTEQMPFVILEAMDAGLPVVSSDVGDVRHMTAEVNRPFIGAATEQALARGLKALIGDAGLRREIGEANRARRRELFSLHEMVEAYRALFDRMLAGADVRSSAA